MTQLSLKNTAKQIASKLGVLEAVQRKRLSKKLKVKFEQDLQQFLKFHDQTERRFALNGEDLIPCLEDNTSYTWFDRHYIYHPAWAARLVKRISPAYHVDISSTLSFSSMLSAFLPVKFYDYRPAKLILDGLSSDKADLTKLHFESNSIQSLSCMHTVEHIGLGRYGDPLDYDGDLKAMKELSRVVAKGGNLLFVVPVGGEARIMFNAHRVYTKQMIVDSFPDLTLKEYALVSILNDDYGLILDPSEEVMSKERYGCGCFWFVKV